MVRSRIVNRHFVQYCFVLWFEINSISICLQIDIAQTQLHCPTSTYAKLDEVFGCLHLRCVYECVHMNQVAHYNGFFE